MAKAINWPKAFEATILAEDTTQIYCALRLGTLYYDNRYWVADEVVDIRADQQVVRQGVIVGDLKCCAIDTLTSDDLKQHKPGVQTVNAIVQHLMERYRQPVTSSDVVTVVYYRNL